MSHLAGQVILDHLSSKGHQLAADMDREAEEPALEIKGRQATGSVAKVVTSAAGWEVSWGSFPRTLTLSLRWEFSEGRGAGE